MGCGCQVFNSRTACPDTSWRSLQNATPEHRYTHRIEVHAVFQRHRYTLLSHRLGAGLEVFLLAPMLRLTRLSDSTGAGAGLDTGSPNVRAAARTYLPIGSVSRTPLIGFSWSPSGRRLFWLSAKPKSLSRPGSYFQPIDGTDLVAPADGAPPQRPPDLAPAPPPSFGEYSAQTPALQHTMVQEMTQERSRAVSGAADLRPFCRTAAAAQDTKPRALRSMPQSSGVCPLASRELPRPCGMDLSGAWQSMGRAFHLQVLSGQGMSRQFFSSATGLVAPLFWAFEVEAGFVYLQSIGGASCCCARQIVGFSRVSPAKS